jgi:hypothetical protein
MGYQNIAVNFIMSLLKIKERNSILSKLHFIKILELAKYFRSLVIMIKLDNHKWFIGSDIEIMT